MIRDTANKITCTLLATIQKSHRHAVTAAELCTGMSRPKIPLSFAQTSCWVLLERATKNTVPDVVCIPMAPARLEVAATCEIIVEIYGCCGKICS